MSLEMRTLNDAGPTQLSVDGGLSGWCHNRGWLSILVRPSVGSWCIWFCVALLTASSLMAWRQGPRDKCSQEAFKGRPVEQNQQRTGKAREIDLLQVIHSPWDFTPENCILNLGELKGKTVFSLRILYQDQANNNAVVRGLPVGARHNPFLFCLHPKQTSEGLSC